MAQRVVGPRKQLKEIIQTAHNIVKNPNWPVKNHLAVCKRGRRFQLGYQETNSGSDQSGTRSRDRLIASLTHWPLGREQWLSRWKNYNCSLNRNCAWVWYDNRWFIARTPSTVLGYDLLRLCFSLSLQVCAFLQTIPCLLLASAKNLLLENPSLHWRCDKNSLLPFSATSLEYNPSTNQGIIVFVLIWYECFLLSLLQFLEECIAGFVKSDYELKHLCLEYMAPWLPNLARLVSNTVSQIILSVEQHVLHILQMKLVVSNTTLYRRSAGSFLNAAWWNEPID